MKIWISLVIALIVLTSGCLNAKSTGSDTGSDIKLKGLRFNTNVSSALDFAKTQGKPVFVYARSEDCGWCKKFEAETFTNQSVIQTLNDNFILVSIDVYKQRTERINFRVSGTPTEIFLDPNGIEIKRIPGYVETETFLEAINQIAKRHEK